MGVIVREFIEERYRVFAGCRPAGAAKAGAAKAGSREAPGSGAHEVPARLGHRIVLLEPEDLVSSEAVAADDAVLAVLHLQVPVADLVREGVPILRGDRFDHDLESPEIDALLGVGLHAPAGAGH